MESDLTDFAVSGEGSVTDSTTAESFTTVSSTAVSVSDKTTDESTVEEEDSLSTLTISPEYPELPISVSVPEAVVDFFGGLLAFLGFSGSCFTGSVLADD